jgi:hypothetical protein
MSSENQLRPRGGITQQISERGKDVGVQAEFRFVDTGNRGWGRVEENC